MIYTAYTHELSEQFDKFKNAGSLSRFKREIQTAIETKILNLKIVFCYKISNLN